MPASLTQNIDRSDTLLEARGKLVAASRLHWVHWLIVLGSLILTFFAWYYSSSEKTARIQVQFERESDHVIELVKERMGKYEDALWSGVALIRTSGDDIDFQTWQRYANSINIEEKYPGISGIGVVHSVAANELKSYLIKQRLQRPDFQVFPQHDESENFPIAYVIPVKGNEKAVGLDLAHESNRYTAAQRARDTGRSQITGPITLVQDAGKTPGFLFYAPFYKGDKNEGDKSDAVENMPGNSIEDRRDRFAGMVYAPFVVNRLMEGTLGKDKRRVGIRISDGDELLYDEHQGHEQDFDPNPIFTKSVDVELFGRNWKFDIWTTKSFRQATADNQPLSILIGGIVIDTFLILLFLSMKRTSQRSLRLADSMTLQLEKNAVSLELKAIELQHSIEDLRRFNESAVGRELRMIELKHEVNELCEHSGDSRRYRLPTAPEGLTPADSQRFLPEITLQGQGTADKSLESKITRLRIQSACHIKYDGRCRKIPTDVGHDERSTEAKQSRPRAVRIYRFA